MTNENALGHEIYDRKTLLIYDYYVLWFSNSFVWNCPSGEILKHYNKNVGEKHMDVGVGTGYFLDHCEFPIAQPHIHLVDLNPKSLAATSKRISRYRPIIFQANILEPLTLAERNFKSIGMNYLLHCLPGSMTDKSKVFGHLKSFLAPDGVLFGSTILQGLSNQNFLFKKLTQIYNRDKIFSNSNDRLEDLKSGLNTHFAEVQIKTVGHVALFNAKLSK